MMPFISEFNGGRATLLLAFGGRFHACWVGEACERQVGSSDLVQRRERDGPKHWT